MVDGIIRYGLNSRVYTAKNSNREISKEGQDDVEQTDTNAVNGAHPLVQTEYKSIG